MTLLLVGVACSAWAQNPPPSQVYYIPFPENEQLAAFQKITSSATSPLATFITFSTVADNTVIYYDHWEDGYETDITNPKQSTTLVYGDGNPANGFPPGNPGDLIPAGSVFSLRNFVETSTLQSVLDFDARDKVAAFKPISLTKTTYPQSTGSLLAGCFEIYERGIWGTEYRCPVGVNLATSVDADMFSNTMLSIMAGDQGASVQIDADSNGTFEQNVTLREGQSVYLGSVNVGARILSDNPVQVVLFAGRTSSTTYMSRDTSLTPINLWGSSYYCPVSTPATSGSYKSATAVFLHNPGVNEITVTYDYRSSNTAYTSATIKVPAGQTVKTPALINGEAYHFYTSGATPPPFYAFCAVDGASTTTSDNGVWDGGFALIGNPSLTTQILLSFGAGRDPYSATNPNENGNPVYVTPVGNGHTLTRVYVDYNCDNAGSLTDPNGNKYDAHYDVRELDQLKLYDPDGDQSGMLVYTLDANVKLAAAWAQDPAQATAAAPGLDVATIIPPLREGSAGKSSTLAVDADGDGYRSAGDTLAYDIRIVNSARAPISGPFTVKDTLPADTTYVLGTTRYRKTIGGVWAAWEPVPDDLSGSPFSLDDVGYRVPGPLGIGQQIQVAFHVLVDTYPNLYSGRDRIRNIGSVEISPYGTVIPLDWTDPLYGSIGDRIWHDTNGDGVQDAGEVGLANVVVYIDANNNGFKDAGEVTQTTGANGNYVFNGLLAGSYTVRVDPLSVAALEPGYGPTWDLDGIATSYATVVPLLDAQDRTDVDFGFRIGASVGNRVWMDRNANGVKDAGEPGINGVRVYIDSNHNNAYDVGEPNTITSGDGIYYIGNLDAGTYEVRVDTMTLPTSVTQTYDYTSPTTDHEGKATLLGAEHNPNLNFGYRGSLSIGDLVWNDINGNGQKDGSEAGISGVRVYIDFNENGVFDATEPSAITAANGSYTIGNLFNGTFTVSVDTSTLPNSMAQTFDLTAPLNDNTATVVLNNANRTDVDFGYRDDASLGDRVWNDMNNNGQQDPGEPGLAGVVVYIDANSNGKLDVGEIYTTTDITGYYLFDNLAAGTYRVQVDLGTLPLGSTQTYDLDGVGTAHYASRKLTVSQDATDVDFGYRSASSLGDSIWNDLNGDGVQDAGEPGIHGVRVFVDSNGNGVWDSATEPSAITAGNGTYAIVGLTAGAYTVRVDPTTLPMGMVQTYDLTGALDNTATVAMSAGQIRTDVDFGYVSKATLGDRVWNDTNGDGVQDVGETGTNGVRVFVDFNNNGIWDSGSEPAAVTAGDGDYSITGLLPGSYNVRVDVTTLPPGLAQTYDLTGALDNAAFVTVAAGEVRMDVDFGYAEPGTVGGHLYLDTNGNGTQDPGEPDLANVNVVVTDSKGGKQTAVTGADGNWTATVPPGATSADVDETDPDYPTGYSQTDGDDPTHVIAISGTNVSAGNDGYFLPAPAIELTKTASPQTFSAAGDVITYTFTVKNTGNVTLSNVTIADAKVTVQGGPLASLAVGATDNVTFTATYTVTQADVNAAKVDNTATAHAVDPKGNPVNDTDVETVTVVQAPAIELIKTAGNAADGTTLTVAAGTDVVYTYTIKNTGNTYLANVVITDDKLGPVGTIAGPLAPGASVTLTATAVAVSADVVNIATATATPSTAAGAALGGFGPVTDSDDAVVQVTPGTPPPDPTICELLDFGKTFNVIIFGNLNVNGGDTEGNLLVWGHAYLPSGYSVGQAIVGAPMPVAGELDDALIVGGNLYIGGAQGINGNIVYGGSYSGYDRKYQPYSVRHVTPVTLDDSGNVPEDHSGMTHDQMLAQINALSSRLAAMEERGVVSKDVAENGDLILVGDDPVRNIFDLSAAQWSGTSSDRILVVPPGSTVILNIRGADVDIANGGMRLPNGMNPNQVLIHYVDAINVDITGFDHEGSILAPHATATFSGASVHGAAIFGGNVTTSGGAEFHNFPMNIFACTTQPAVRVVTTANDAPDGYLLRLAATADVVVRQTVMNTGSAWLRSVSLTAADGRVVGLADLAPGAVAVHETTFAGVVAGAVYTASVTAVPTTTEGAAIPGFAAVTAGDIAVVAFTGDTGDPTDPIDPGPWTGTPVTGKPDLEITDIWFVSEPTITGEVFSVCVKVENTGDATATGSAINLYLAGLNHSLNSAAADEAPAAALALGTLIPGAVKVFTFNYLVAQLAPGPYRVIALVDPAHVIDEYSDGNNHGTLYYALNTISVSISIGAQGVTLSWNNYWGQIYTVMASPNLTEWAPCSGFENMASSRNIDGSTTNTVTIPFSGGAKFFKLRVDQQ